MAQQPTIRGYHGDCHPLAVAASGGVAREAGGPASRRPVLPRLVLVLLALVLSLPARAMPDPPGVGAVTHERTGSESIEGLDRSDSGAYEAADTDALLESEFLLAESEKETNSLPDPLQPANRVILSFNRFLDRFLIGPTARAYGFVVPGAGKRAVRRVFENLGSTSVFVNDLLQFEGRRAAVTGTRFVLNTTVGIAGIFDPASSLGLEGHHADFGQTLWRYGMGSGPYLVLPLFGPSNARDSVGRLVDFALRIDTWLLAGQQQLVLGAGEGLSLRELHYEAIRELERSSIDYYVALRSAYWMNRQAVLDAARPVGSETASGSVSLGAGSN